jgi:hypothetical protein
MVPRKRDDDRSASPPLIDEELADQLLGKAQAEVRLGHQQQGKPPSGCP